MRAWDLSSELEVRQGSLVQRFEEKNSRQRRQLRQGFLCLRNGKKAEVAGGRAVRLRKGTVADHRAPVGQN